MIELEALTHIPLCPRRRHVRGQLGRPVTWITDFMGDSRLPSSMSPRKCRQLASELRQYADDHPAYWSRARDAADRLEALAEDMERRGLGEDDDPDPMQ